MKQIWTPADVEDETLAGYDPLSAWNRAVVLGGAHYAEWRAAHIGPIEQAYREKYLNSGPYLSRWEYHRVNHKWVWEPRDRREKIRADYLKSYVLKRSS
jgi:hypothetical protein